MPKSWFHRVVGWRRHYESLLPKQDGLKVASTAILFFEKDMGNIAGEHEVGFPAHTIRISPLLHETEAMETMGHEYAHLCNWILNEERGHGVKWKKIMCQLGLPPHVGHNIPITTRKLIVGIFEKIDVNNKKTGYGKKKDTDL